MPPRRQLDAKVSNDVRRINALKKFLQQRPPAFYRKPGACEAEKWFSLTLKVLDGVGRIPDTTNMVSYRGCY